MLKHFDAVVVGSGFGGAITACRLAQAGLTVAVLEKGRRWDSDEFPRTMGGVSEAFWQSGKSHGFLEYRAFRRVDVIQGVGVGGGSLHYFNVHLRPPAEIFDRPGWPQVITRRVLDPYYDLSQDMMESRPLTPPVGRRDLPPRTRVFLDAARGASYPPELVDIAVFTGADRAHPAGGHAQTACTYCSNCLFGCQLHAKNTLDITYLGLAERSYGATVLPLHEARCILRRKDGSYCVQFLQRLEDPTLPGKPGEVCASKVIIAAGTLGSMRLLLSCRDRERTLPELSPGLGSRVSLNGEYLLGYAADTTARVDPGVGPPITASLTISTNGHVLTVQDLGLPDVLFWYFEGMLPPRRARLHRVADVATAYVCLALGLSSRRDRMADEIGALVAGGRTPWIMPFLGMGTDAANGHAHLNGDDIDIKWDHRPNRDLYRLMHEAMTRISEAAGGRFQPSFLLRWPLGKILTAHPLGGCPMGENPRSSVVNDRGEVHKLPNLYVVDGSIIPAALAVNPSLTISALAERAAFWMLHGREMRAGDPLTPPNRELGALSSLAMSG